MIENKKKRGRPTQDISKDNRINFRLNNEELQMLNEVCEHYGVSKSDAVRYSVKFMSEALHILNSNKEGSFKYGY